MSNGDIKLVENIQNQQLTRLWRLQTKANMLVSDGNRTAKELADAIQEVIDGPRFKLIEGFNIDVPEIYLRNQNDALKGLLGSSDIALFEQYNLDFVRKNMEKWNDASIPEHMGVRVYELNEPVSTEECRDFLRLKRARLLGLHGIQLAIYYSKPSAMNILEKAKCNFSLSQGEEPKNDKGHPMLPVLLKFMNGSGVGIKFLHHLNPGDRLLCFNDASDVK